MAPIKTVAVAGATGALGDPLVKALLEAGFEVTALTRNSKQTLPPSVKVAQVDYNDVDSLTSALRGHDALVATLNAAAIDTQQKLVEAAIAAGVKRVIPSEFGMDLSNPKARAVVTNGYKVQVEAQLEKHCQGTETTYTFVANNLYLDWGLNYKFLLDLQDKSIEICDGGDRPVSLAPMTFVAKGVAAVLQHPEETANKHINLHGTALSQKQLLEIAKRVVGPEGWKVTEANTEDLEKESYEIMKNDYENTMGWFIGFLKRGSYAEGYGNDFSSNNANKMLGLKELSEQEVEDVVRTCA